MAKATAQTAAQSQANAQAEVDRAQAAVTTAKAAVQKAQSLLASAQAKAQDALKKYQDGLNNPFLAYALPLLQAALDTANQAVATEQQLLDEANATLASAEQTLSSDQSSLTAAIAAAQSANKDAQAKQALADELLALLQQGTGGTTEIARQTVGSSGGRIQSASITLTIPPGALSSDTEIVISAIQPSSALPGEAYSPVFQFEPSGTTFAAGVTISIPYRGSDPDAVLMWTKAGDETTYEQAGFLEPENGMVRGLVFHFSSGYVGKLSASVDTLKLKIGGAYMWLSRNGQSGVELQNNITNYCAGASDLITDPSVRSLSVGMCNGINDPDLHNLCLGGSSCNLIMDTDMRNLCLGDCTLVKDPQMSSYCIAAKGDLSACNNAGGGTLDSVALQKVCGSSCVASAPPSDPSQDLVKAVIVAENIAHDVAVFRANHSQLSNNMKGLEIRGYAQWDSYSGGPLLPAEAGGQCGIASYSAAEALMAMGYDDSRIRTYANVFSWLPTTNDLLFVANSQGHSVAMVKDTAPSPPKYYLIDATFNQFMEPTGSDPNLVQGNLLRQTSAGQAICGALQKQGFFEATPQSLQTYFEAFGWNGGAIDPGTLFSHGHPPKLQLACDQNGFPPTDVKGQLDAITPDDIDRRLSAGSQSGNGASLAVSAPADPAAPSCTLCTNKPVVGDFGNDVNGGVGRIFAVDVASGLDLSELDWVAVRDDLNSSFVGESKSGDGIFNNPQTPYDPANPQSLMPLLDAFLDKTVAQLTKLMGTIEQMGADPASVKWRNENGAEVPRQQDVGQIRILKLRFGGNALSKDGFDTLPPGSPLLQRIDERLNQLRASKPDWTISWKYGAN